MIIDDEDEREVAARWRRWGHSPGGVLFTDGQDRDRDCVIILHRDEILRARPPARQFDRKSRTLADLALNRDRSLVEPYDLLDQRQPDPAPFIPSCCASFHLGEAVKDPLQLVPRNADPIVFDFKFYAVFFGCQPHPDLPLLGIIELERI